VAWVASDAYIATAAAIDDRVASLVNEVGGFVAIADESKFPTTNPDIENNTGTIVSITALSADRTASNTGVLTTGFATDESPPADVTITGCTNDQVYKQGYGLQVETTEDDNEYTFVRYIPQTSDVTAIAAITGDISTVAAINSGDISTVAAIDEKVEIVANNEIEIDNITTNLTAVQNAATNAATAEEKAGDAADAADAAELDASAAAISASAAAGAVTALNTLSYYHDLGSITDTAGTTTDYGEIT